MRIARWARTLSGFVAGLLILGPVAVWVGRTPAFADHGEVVTTAVVTKVIDGDTIEVEIGRQTERVRLLGVDTPESVALNTPDQCFGLEAAAALRGMVGIGDTVLVASDVERRDFYGRLLLFVSTTEGVMVNHWLLEGGFADTLFIAPNGALEAEFTAARNAARAAGAGLWGACDGPDQPLD